MALKMSILTLSGLVAVVASNPFGFGVEVGGKSQLGGGASAGGKVGAGVDQGLNAGGKGEAEVHGSWIKSLFGKVYVADKHGKGIGLGASVGSDMGGVVNGSAAIGADTVIVRSNAGARTGLDADGHYRAGAEVHVLDQDELTIAVGNARTFTDGHDERYIDSQKDEATRPKYTKWLD